MHNFGYGMDVSMSARANMHCIANIRILYLHFTSHSEQFAKLGLPGTLNKPLFLSASHVDVNSIQVNAETKVHWFFLAGAHVLHHIHGRDSIKLQKGRQEYINLYLAGRIICTSRHVINSAII